MRDTTQFRAERQRAALVAMARSANFLQTREGQRFLSELRERLAPAVLAVTRGIGAGWLTEHDVTHTAVVRLLANDGRVARYAARADTEPWRYLFRCMCEWTRDEVGLRADPVDHFFESQLKSLAPEAEGVPQLTALRDVVELSYGVLENRTPVELRAELRSLLNWLAHNPPQRLSYEMYEREAATVAFPGLSATQIAAVMRISWGVRPSRSETSLFGKFLTDCHFRPSDSLAMTRALSRYSRDIARSDLVSLAQAA